mmetsp:Transcript_16910/g.34497  ORF Transcript_16910/g.34497 Transcript_16910/m.34497 type:complete len:200 (+) Transcript_16910:177-776(+)
MGGHGILLRPASNNRAMPTSGHGRRRPSNGRARGWASAVRAAPRSSPPRLVGRRMPAGPASRPTRPRNRGRRPRSAGSRSVRGAGRLSQRRRGSRRPPPRACSLPSGRRPSRKRRCARTRAPARSGARTWDRNTPSSGRHRHTPRSAGRCTPSAHVLAASRAKSPVPPPPLPSCRNRTPPPRRAATARPRRVRRLWAGR